MEGRHRRPLHSIKQDREESGENQISVAVWEFRRFMVCHYSARKSDAGASGKTPYVNASSHPQGDYLGHFRIRETGKTVK